MLELAKMDHTNSKYSLIQLLSRIPREQFTVLKILSHDYFNGVAVVRNDKLAGRIESIKFLRTAEPHSRETFLKEGKLLSAIQHKNIPQMYDILEHDDYLLFRSEYIDGYSLEEVIEYCRKKKKEFPKNAAASIILKLTNALYYTHHDVKYERKKKSIIHCDIKPSNIILSFKNHKRKSSIDDEFFKLLNDNKAEPFLIDFGIAKFKGESATTDGTLNYLSPAQAKGEKCKTLDWRTDTYQLMLVYHEMLTLQKPFSGMSRKKVIEQKTKYDFHIAKNDNIPHSIKELIEKGTSRTPEKYYKTEKECLRAACRANKKQQIYHAFNRQKKPILVSLIILAAIILFLTAWKFYDEKILSTDAIIESLRDGNQSPEQIMEAIEKIQQRAFLKKYYEPLVNGEFRDSSTGKPMYPSHLNADGEWILYSPETEEAGIFAGLLFEYAHRYPGKYSHLEEYAAEYTEPILNSEFDGTAGKRYMYALIPAYEHTGDERYLNKLVEVADTSIDFMKAQKGMTQVDDLYYADLFIFVYNKTGERRYLEFFDGYVREFIKNNIDEDGYIYMFASVNATSPYGPMPDAKYNWVTESYEDYPVGIPIEISQENFDDYKIIAGMYSRDYFIAVETLARMYHVTQNFEYLDALDKTISFYLKNSIKYEGKEKLFTPSKQNMLSDSLGELRKVFSFKQIDSNDFNDELNTFMFHDNFRRENENGIITGNVFIEGVNYAIENPNNNNQTLILADYLFLTII